MKNIINNKMGFTIFIDEIDISKEDNRIEEEKPILWKAFIKLSL